MNSLKPTLKAQQNQNQNRSTKTQIRALPTNHIDSIKMGLMRKLMWCRKRSFSFPAERPEASDLGPKGHIRVVVRNAESKEVAEFEIEAIYLNHPLLEKLLSLTGEEYGYCYGGALRIACDVHLFRYLIQLLNARNPSAHYMDLPDLIAKFSNAAAGYRV